MSKPTKNAPKPKKVAFPKPGAFSKPTRLKRDPSASQEAQGSAAANGFKSPAIEAKSLELDQQCAFINQIIKSIKKQSKNLHPYLESANDLTVSLNAFAANSEDDLALIMDISGRVSKGWVDCLRELEKDGLQLEEELEFWVTDKVQPSRIQRKAFENQRSAMDKTTKNLAKTDPVNAQKYKEAEDANSKQETAYMQQGENTYYCVNDTLAGTKMNSTLKMIENFHNYYKFFSNGLALLEQERAKILELEAKVLEEQQKFHQEIKLPNRPRGLWLADGGEAESAAQRKVFHVNYEEVVARESPDEQILPFLDYSLSYLEQPSILETQGLFRLSANKPQLDALRAKIDKGYHEFNQEELDDPHMVTGIVKLFLRSLPEPLLTFELYSQWIEIPELPTTQQQVAKFRTVVEKLPVANRILLQRLLHTCSKILEYSSVNLMNVNNIAIVLGPTILYDRDLDEISMVQSIQKSNQVVVILVSNFAEIFKDMTVPEPRHFPILGAVAPPAPAGNRSTIPETTNPPLTHSGKALPSTNQPSRGGFQQARVKASVTTGDDSSSHEHSGPAPLPSSADGRRNAGAVLPAWANAESPNKAQPAPPAAAIQTQNLGDGDTIVPTKYTEKGDIIPSLTALSQKMFLQLVGSLPSTRGFYVQLYEMFTSAFTFTRAAHNLVNFSQEELTSLNAAFQNVARAIRNMLAMIKEYTSKFPSEVARRILQCAHEVRPHIKSLITCVKAYNSGSRADKPAFMESSKNFLIAVYQMYIVCTRASQMDPLCQTGAICSDYVAKLKDDLATHQPPAVMSLSINNLQNATLEFTSLLRARVQDISDQAIQSQLSVVVEATELCISEIFDEARNILQSASLESTPLIENKLATLSKIISTTVALQPVISTASLEAPILDMIYLTHEQLASVIEMHSGESGTVQLLLNDLSTINTCLTTMTTFFKEPNCSPTTHSLEWLNACHDVVTSLNNVIDLVNKVATIGDESLAATLKSYADSIRHFLIQFQISGCAMVWDIRILGYDDSKCLAPLKDFAFITFPFSYNFRDAAAEYDSTPH